MKVTQTVSLMSHPQLVSSESNIPLGIPLLVAITTTAYGELNVTN